MESVERVSIREGDPVFLTTGGRLGKITLVLRDGFVVERGWLLPKLRFVPFSAVERELMNGVLVRREAVREWSPDLDVEDTKFFVRPADTPLLEERRRRRIEDFRVPVVEERLEVERSMQEVARVRLKKRLITEQRTIVVPVVREEVYIERLPAAGDATAPPIGDGQDVVTVSVMEERVDIVKRPVVKEEVHVVKEAHTEERKLTAEVSKEETRVEREDPGH